ncbi:MAG TPA: 50S ribosomal protein L4 [Candidatus Ornithospirochaeta avicola]|uniref:Large ribosomal subunit protein uL4 n=1 Tax=Candidatus Ornithospirochaeta avicola TaxID=2840896 RepID=A0A9D1PTG7_9SPIO|nr:50S ribosomal protein L4 [Candidatus Ornithospirochaeta avicola]
MEQKVFSTTGKEIRTINLDEKVFAVEVSNGAIYHAIRNEAANRRVGTACTKTRAEVNYSNTKPYKQKGTGNARRGDKKSPISVGGGTIFGPKPRDYSYTLPKKVKRLAMLSLLSLGVEEGRLCVIEDFTSENGKTKDLAQIMKAFETENQRTVIIMKDDDPMLRRAARNIPYLHVLAYDKLSAKELLYGRKILVLESACQNLSDFYGEF